MTDGRSHYVAATITRASLGDYLADDCRGTVPYALPADFLKGPGKVWVLDSSGRGQDAGAYLQLEVPFAGQVVPAAGVAICDSCDVAPGACPVPPAPGIASPVVPGRLEIAVPPLHIPPGSRVFGTGAILHFTK